MHDHFLLPLWAQGQGQGIGEFIGVIIFLLIVFFQFIRTVFEARKGEAASAPPPRSRQQRQEQQHRPPEREARPAPRPEMAWEQDRIQEEEQRGRTALVRELAPQGVGQRFEVAPGTLDASNLEGTSLEPTVKPTLDSMTGIYEASPTSEERPDQPLTLDIQKLMARPEGIRQAIILAEILKRPDYEETKFSLR